MPSNSFHYRHRVTYAECTLGNHIYYSRYLDLLEAARGELFRATGFSLLRLQEEGFIFPVVECHLYYQAPARYDDRLDLAVELVRLDRLRLHFKYELKREDGAQILSAETHHVCTGLDERPKRLPAEVVEKLRVYDRSR